MDAPAPLGFAGLMSILRGLGRREPKYPTQLRHVTLSNGVELVTLHDGTQVAFRPQNGGFVQVPVPPSPPLLFHGFSDAADYAIRALSQMPEEMPTDLPKPNLDDLDSAVLQAYSWARK